MSPEKYQWVRDIALLKSNKASLKEVYDYSNQVYKAYIGVGSDNGFSVTVTSRVMGDVKVKITVIKGTHEFGVVTFSISSDVELHIAPQLQALISVLNTFDRE